MTGDASAAEDLAQETLIVAMKKWNTFDGQSSRMTWLHGILIRLTRKHFRTIARVRRRIECYVGIRSQTDAQQDHAQQIAEQEWHSSVWAEVQKLPRRQAEAITLRFGQQMSYDAAAEALGCATGTVKSRVHLGLKRLREQFGEQAMSHGIQNSESTNG